MRLKRNLHIRPGRTGTFRVFLHGGDIENKPQNCWSVPDGLVQQPNCSPNRHVDSVSELGSLGKSDLEHPNDNSDIRERGRSRAGAYCSRSVPAADAPCARKEIG